MLRQRLIVVTTVINIRLAALIYLLCIVTHMMCGHTYSKSMDQPGKVANPGHGELIFPCPRSRLRIWSRETGSVVPSRASLLISILRLNLVHTYGIPPEFHGGIHLFI